MPSLCWPDWPWRPSLGRGAGSSWRTRLGDLAAMSRGSVWRSRRPGCSETPSSSARRRRCRRPCWRPSPDTRICSITASRLRSARQLASMPSRPWLSERAPCGTTGTRCWIFSSSRRPCFLWSGCGLLRARSGVKGALMALGVTLAATAILFPVPTMAGTFYHDAGAFAPWLALGLVVLARRVMKEVAARRRWRSDLLGLALAVILVVTVAQLALSVTVVSAQHRAEARRLAEAAAYLGAHPVAPVISTAPYNLNFLDRLSRADAAGSAGAASGAVAGGALWRPVPGCDRSVWTLS